MRKGISLVLLLSFLFMVAVPAYGNDMNGIQRFNDVPTGHWADETVHRARQLGITDGLGDNQFGLGMTISRAEYVALLVKLMQWPVNAGGSSSFDDNNDPNAWYYNTLETAVQQGMLTAGGQFGPTDNITREEMAVLAVSALGFRDLGNQLASSGTAFGDVTQNQGYIALASDLGLMSGIGNGQFAPRETATREQAVSMMVRLYDQLQNQITQLHGFYAIKSSGQSSLMNDMDSVSFGWSRLALNNGQVVLNTSNADNNEYGLPSGFSTPLNQAKNSGATTQLMVFADDQSLLSSVLLDPAMRTQAVQAITNQVVMTAKDGEAVAFDGVTIDFESMKGEALKQGFNQFLSELKQQLSANNKHLYVAVHPKMRNNQAYFDGYDYATIGQIADKVILMASDYYAKSLTQAEMDMGYTKTPLSPLADVYYGLKMITDPQTGVADTSKIWLQVSMDSVQWKLQNGKVINQKPYHPSYEAIASRLATGVSVNYPNYSYNPYATYFDANDGTDNILWYEDARSVAAKMELARLFGIQGISIWRLGNIPTDVWQQVIQTVK